MRSEKVSWGNFFGTVLTIALPIAFQNFLSTTASMVDTIMIGSQGELSVAAVGICSQITSLPVTSDSQAEDCYSFHSIGAPAMKRVSTRLLAWRLPACLPYPCSLAALR